MLSLACAGDAEPSDDERAALRRVAALIAVAIDRARLGSMVAERSEWFERMAHTDPLTGLANERTFARILELELARAGRQGGEVSLAVFDVDGLTATNEAAGHAVGDDVLRAVAAVLAESVRLVDTVARVGGDEFVLVAPGVGRDRPSPSACSTGSPRCRPPPGGRSPSRPASPGSRSTGAERRRAVRPARGGRPGRALDRRRGCSARTPASTAGRGGPVRRRRADRSRRDARRA